MRISTRGLVWVGVGIVLAVGNLLLDRPIVLRQTTIPLGYIIIGLGVALILWDGWKARHHKENPEESERNTKHGGAGD
jgi:hypothetical protein